MVDRGAVKGVLAAVVHECQADTPSNAVPEDVGADVHAALFALASSLVVSRRFAMLGALALLTMLAGTRPKRGLALPVRLPGRAPSGSGPAFIIQSSLHIGSACG